MKRFPIALILILLFPCIALGASVSLSWNPPTFSCDGSTLDDLLIEGYSKIITGAEDISYYDTLMQDWRRAGGDAVTAAVNEMYGQ